jgi:uncharacterized GH25 family protein
MYKRVGTAVALVMLTATMVLAHDLFLKLQTYFVPPNSSVRVAVLNGTFATSEGAVVAARLRDLSLVGTAERTQLPRDNWKPVGDTTWLSIRTGASGTYLVGASLLPREIALSADDFNSYLREDGIPDVLDDRTRSGTLTQAVRERYQKHVKAIFQVGDTRTSAYATVLGYPAEIVPLMNPYERHIGDSLAVRCLVDGKPVARQLVIAGGERAGQPMQEVRARTDGNGVARFALASAGKWYIKFIHMAAVSTDSVNYESKWATLTFEVR